MKREFKLKSQEQQHELKIEHQSATHQREFTTPEEMLRHDAVHTPVPPSIGRRLAETLSSEKPLGNRPWWKKLLGL